MNILLTANHLFRAGGSETFTRTIAREFERRGDFVEVLTIDGGIYALREELNVVAQPTRSSYDLILVSHNTCLPKVSLCAGPKVFTSHGTFPQLEQPQSGADFYVAISEEVADHVKKLGFEATVIRNGVDLNVFKPDWADPRKVSRVLSLVQSDAAYKMLAEACKKMGVSLVRGVSLSEKDLVGAILAADVVVSLGRGVIEAMACGRAAFVFDARWYMGGQCLSDGYVTANNWRDLARCNFSGRRSRTIMSVDLLVADLLSYRPGLGPSSHHVARTNFDVAKKVDEYLALAGLA